MHRGLSVAVIDDHSGPSQWYFPGYGLRENLTIWTGDVRDRSWLEMAEHGGDPRFIFACASPGSVADFSRDPVRTVTTNVMGLANCIEMAERTGATLLFISSSEAYGFSYGLALLEGQPIICKTHHYRAPYEEGKRAGEAMLLEKVSREAIKGVAARLFSVYGPRLGLDRRMMSEFIFRAIRDEPLEIDGKGDQITTACYVSDAVDQIIGLIEAAEGRTLSNLPVNVGHQGWRPVREFAEEIIKILNSRSEIIYAPARPHNPEIRVPDMTAMWNVIGHGPKVSFREGVERTAEFYRTHQMGRNVWERISAFPA